MGTPLRKRQKHCFFCVLQARVGKAFRWTGFSFIKCNILEVFFVKKDCIGDELVLISGELAAY